MFTPLKLREITSKNRIWLPPMCQYSAINGVAQPWHWVHYGARAVGGLGAIIVEATAVCPEGRISSHDLGLWNDEQADAIRPVAQIIKQQGCIAAIQLAHAGRKASTSVPWVDAGAPILPGEKKEGHELGWVPVAPSALPFSSHHSIPQELTETEIHGVLKNFEDAAHRALQAGFQMIEIHSAHGYLLHEFLSPLTNQRKDQYGGSLENRLRFPMAVATSLRKIWPASLPVAVRLSATDWKEGGWDLPQSVVYSKKLKELGIDFIDVSTGGLVPDAVIPAGPGFQVPFSDAIRKEAGIATGAVGIITEAHQANEIIFKQQADVVLLGRELLRTPQWPMQAAVTLGAQHVWPKQYERAKR